MKKLTSILALALSFYNATAQNVGIGTAAPLLPLHVSKAADSALLLLENVTPLATGINTGMYFKTGAFYTGAIKTIGTSGVDSRLGFFAFSNSIGRNNLKEYMSIADDGKVGIGTTLPTAVLDVNGTFRLRGNGAAAGRLLTSDASGNATWKAPAAGSAAFSGTLTNSLFLISNNDVDIAGYTESYDDGGNFNPSTGRFTAPADGLYSFTYNLNFTETGTDTKYVRCFVKLNGGTNLSYNYITPGISGNASTNYTNTFQLQLDAGQYVQLNVQRSAVSGNELRGGNFANSTYFSGYRIN